MLRTSYGTGAITCRVFCIPFFLVNFVIPIAIVVDGNTSWIGLPWVVHSVLSQFIWRCCVVCESCCDCIVVCFIWGFIHEQQVFCFEISSCMIGCCHSACFRCFPNGFSLSKWFPFSSYPGGWAYPPWLGGGNVQPKRYIALPLGSWYTWICSNLVCFQFPRLRHYENAFKYKAKGRRKSTRLYQEISCGTRCAQVTHWRTHTNPHQVCWSHGQVWWDEYQATR